jgi:hypothetical protein
MSKDHCYDVAGKWVPSGGTGSCNANGINGLGTMTCQGGHWGPCDTSGGSGKPGVSAQISVNGVAISIVVENTGTKDTGPSDKIYAWIVDQAGKSSFNPSTSQIQSPLKAGQTTTASLNGTGQGLIFTVVVAYPNEKSVIASKVVKLGTANFSVSGDDAVTEAKARGFQFKVSGNQHCQYLGPNSFGAVLIHTDNSDFDNGANITGAKCDFLLFTGKRLEAGWSLLSAEVVCQGQHSRVDKTGTPGTTDAEIKVHVWKDLFVNGDAIKANGLKLGDTGTTCTLTQLTLTGPKGDDWHNAFH